MGFVIVLSDQLLDHFFFLSVQVRLGQVVDLWCRDDLVSQYWPQILDPWVHRFLQTARQKNEIKQVRVIVSSAYKDIDIIFLPSGIVCQTAGIE